MDESALSGGIAVIGWIVFALATLGVVYLVMMLVGFRRFFASRPVAASDGTEAITILKPLCGNEPNLEANLRTFVEQDYGGPIQILCGYADSQDEAAAAVSALRASLPAADIASVVAATRHGPSAKVSNLVNLYAEARHPIVILSDSDMSVGRHYLAHVTGELARDGVGAVTLLYRGRGDAGFWSTMAAAGISYQFLPNVVFGKWTSLASPCMGSTIAMRREVLERIGRLESFSHSLADDYAIGEAVRRIGLTVSVPPLVITHACAETSFVKLWRQEIRWGSTVRAVVPLRYLGSLIAYPLPLSIVGALMTQRFDVGVSLIALSTALRVLQAVLVDREVGARTAPVWLLPLRDCLSFTVFVASFFVRRVDWRGHRHLVQAGGRLIVEEQSA